MKKIVEAELNGNPLPCRFPHADFTILILKFELHHGYGSLSVPTQGRAILSPYPTTTIELQYKNLEQCIHAVGSRATSFMDGSRANGPWILLYGVDEHAYDEIRNSDHGLLTIFTKLFNPAAELLVLKLESTWHSTTSMAVARWIDEKARTMNVDSEIVFTGTANYELALFDENGQPSISEGLLLMVQKKSRSNDPPNPRSSLSDNEMALICPRSSLQRTKNPHRARHEAVAPSHRRACRICDDCLRAPA
jgi:hypothetical protein